MKAMVVSDFMIAKKYLIQQLITASIVGVFIAIMLETPYVVAPAVGVMIPFSLSIVILSLDERADWQQFRLALPLTRADIIRGRYASLALISLAGVVGGLLVTFLLVALAHAVPSVPQLASLLVDYSWQAIAFACVASLVIILLMLSLIMPLFSRFGMTKGVRYLPLVVVFAVVIGFQVGGNSVPAEFLSNVGNLLETPAGTAAVAAGTLAVVAALYAASAALSVKLYAKREL